MDALRLAWGWDESTLPVDLRFKLTEEEINEATRNHPTFGGGHVPRNVPLNEDDGLPDMEAIGARELPGSSFDKTKAATEAAVAEASFRRELRSAGLSIEDVAAVPLPDSVTNGADPVDEARAWLLEHKGINFDDVEEEPYNPQF
jgi:hypothetical protein